MCKRKGLFFFPKSIIKKVKLSDFTTFKIGGKATVICPRNMDELVLVLKRLEDEKMDFKMLGNGSNLLASDKKHKQIFVCTKQIVGFWTCSNQVEVSCGTTISELIFFCQKNNLSGLENLFGIPATVGGMIVMNAGAFQTNIFDRLSKLKVFKNGEVCEIEPKTLKKENHWSELLQNHIVVLSATFELENKSSSEIAENIRKIVKLRTEKQPKGNSAGCVFKNPENQSAGKLIDEAGLKGTKIGNAIVSEKHANFIISNGAKSKDVLKLVKLVQRKVFEKFEIMLETEIEIIGENHENHR